MTTEASAALVYACSDTLCNVGMQMFIGDYAHEINGPVMFFFAKIPGGGAAKKLLADTIPDESQQLIHFVILVGHQQCTQGTRVDCTRNLHVMQETFPYAHVVCYWIDDNQMDLLDPPKKPVYQYH